eukprot:SAG11_NODE_2120_length_3790_cov_6.378759_1_plen_50_part_00
MIYPTTINDVYQASFEAGLGPAEILSQFERQKQLTRRAASRIEREGLGS